MSKPVVLITGCSSGIGRGLALEFYKKGCRVFASARSVGKLDELKAAGLDVIQLDVTNADSCKRAVEEIISKAGRIDILVNNAGLSSYAPAIEVSLQEARELMETNYFGVITLTQLVAHKSMIPERSGKIVMISSMMGDTCTPWNSTYGATKAAITRFSDSMRVELAPFGIKVITVKPGGVKSDIAANAQGKVEAINASSSIYRPIIDFIIARSQASQHHPMPTEEFAEKVVADVLKPNPSSIQILGKNSFLLYLATFFPSWVADWYFSRRFGLNKLRALLGSQPAEPKKGK